MIEQQASHETGSSLSLILARNMSTAYFRVTYGEEDFRIILLLERNGSKEKQCKNANLEKATWKFPLSA